MELFSRAGICACRGFLLSRYFIIPSIIKFPRAVSKNGIINSFLSINLVGSFCSTVANLLLYKLSLVTQEKNYLNLVSSTLEKTQFFAKILILFFTLTASAFLTDLNYKFLEALDFQKLFPKKYLTSVLCLLLLIVVLADFEISFFMPLASINTLVYLSVLIILIVFVSSKSSRISFKNMFSNESNRFYDSFPLTFLCFTQQLNVTGILFKQNSFSIVICGFLSSLYFFIFGAIGFAILKAPEVMFFKTIDSDTIRILGTILFLACNLIYLKSSINSIVHQIEIISGFSMPRIYKVLSKVSLIVFLSYLAVRFIKSKASLICALLFSCIVMTIIPSIMYLYSRSKQIIFTVLATINFSIGCFFFYITVFDVKNKFV